jgi:hypothetical protein
MKLNKVSLEEVIIDFPVFFLTHIKMHVSLYITECSSNLQAIIRKFGSRDIIT